MNKAHDICIFNHNHHYSINKIINMTPNEQVVLDEYVHMLYRTHDPVCMAKINELDIITKCKDWDNLKKDYHLGKPFEFRLIGGKLLNN